MLNVSVLLKLLLSMEFTVSAQKTGPGPGKPGLPHWNERYGRADSHMQNVGAWPRDPGQVGSAPFPSRALGSTRQPRVSGRPASERFGEQTPPSVGKNISGGELMETASSSLGLSSFASLFPGLESWGRGPGSADLGYTPSRVRSSPATPQPACWDSPKWVCLEFPFAAFWKSRLNKITILVKCQHLLWLHPAFTDFLTAKAF